MRLYWEIGRKPCEITSGNYIGRLGENLMVGRTPCDITSGDYIGNLGEKLVR